MVPSRMGSEEGQGAVVREVEWMPLTNPGSFQHDDFQGRDPGDDHANLLMWRPWTRQF